MLGALRARLARSAALRRIYDWYLIAFRHTHFSGRMMTCHRAGFMDDDRFRKAFAVARARDGCDYAWRAHVACWAARHAAQLEGDFVECGVNRAHLSAAIIDYLDFARLATKTFYLFDTFQGLVDSQVAPEDRGAYRHVYEECYDEVRAFFSSVPNVRLVRGEVPHSLTTVAIDNVAYLSIDMNCAAPERAALDHFWPKVVRGGVVLLDDYAWLGYENQKKAHDEFARRAGVEILCLPTGQGLITKP